MENVVFALFMIIAPADGAQDEWFALDGNMSRVDCIAAAMDTDRHKAAQTLFGKPSEGVTITMRCDIDNAPETWGS